jgi:hypothetical protein
MGLKKKAKRLEWWVEKFGEVDGKALFIEQQRHKRKRTIELVKTLSGITFLLRLLGK